MRMILFEILGQLLKDGQHFAPVSMISADSGDPLTFTSAPPCGGLYVNNLTIWCVGGQFSAPLFS